MSTAPAPGPIDRLAKFATTATMPDAARRRAAAAILDTIGVTLAGAIEPASRIVREVVSADGAPCAILGTDARADAAGAALANGTAAHALDFDDMCFVSLAHPSAPLVAALVAAGDATGAAGAALVDGYVIGFEIEARLGALMNPRHYERGWHCTSTIGVVGAAAGVSRVLGLDAARAGHAIAIAASMASGLKENFGTMTKPLHAGLAAQGGVRAAQLAARGFTASAGAMSGPQGYLRAFDSQGTGLDEAIGDLGSRWEIVDTGITVKLYPSCAGTHPTLDAVLDLIGTHGITAEDVERVEVGVDPITPTVLIHDRPSTGLEAKFSMPFCVAAAIVDGRVGVDTFAAERLRDSRLGALMPHVSMTVDPSIDAGAPPLTEARVRITLRDGRVLARDAHGARGYPSRPASDVDLDAKFLACATRVLGRGAAPALARLRQIDSIDDVRALTTALSPSP